MQTLHFIWAMICAVCSFFTSEQAVRVSTALASYLSIILSLVAIFHIRMWFKDQAKRVMEKLK